jgi:hypothetical protein
MAKVNNYEEAPYLAEINELEELTSRNVPESLLGGQNHITTQRINNETTHLFN